MHGDPWGTRRIYLSPDMAMYCLVDAVDFEWALQWRWHAKATHSHNCKTAKVKTPRDARGQFRTPADDALLAEF